MIRDSNPDCRINPDPDICRICHKIVWMHYLVGVSHFAEYGSNRPLIVWEMLTKCPKIPYSTMVKKMKKWSWIHTQIRITTKSQPLLDGHSMPLPCQVWSTSVSAFVSYPVYSMTERMTERQNDRQNDRITSAGANKKHRLRRRTKRCVKVRKCQSKFGVRMQQIGGYWHPV